MLKQIEIKGQRFELYSPDEGRTWSSNPRSLVAYGRRKKMLRLELQNSFARIDEMRDLDPDHFSELDTPKSLTKAKEEKQVHSTLAQVPLARIDTVSQRHDLINIAATIPRNHTRQALGGSPR